MKLWPHLTGQFIGCQFNKYSQPETGIAKYVNRTVPTVQKLTNVLTWPYAVLTYTTLRTSAYTVNDISTSSVGLLWVWMGQFYILTGTFVSWQNCWVCDSTIVRHACGPLIFKCKPASRKDSDYTPSTKINPDMDFPGHFQALQGSPGSSTAICLRVQFQWSKAFENSWRQVHKKALVSVCFAASHIFKLERMCWQSTVVSRSVRLAVKSS